MLLHFFGDVVAIVQCGICAFFLTVGKGSHAFESGLSGEFKEFAEILVRLSGETHHKCRAQADAGHFAADGLNQLQGFGFCDMPLHAVEHMVRNVL